MKKKEKDIKEALENTKIEIGENGKLRCKECEEELTIPLEYCQRAIVYYAIGENGDFYRENIYSDEAGSVYCPRCLTDLYDYDEEKTKIILWYLKNLKNKGGAR
ncbi:MAG: hypothetical protein ABIM98_07400 [candidate division WOR-3 bacterium]